MPLSQSNLPLQIMSTKVTSNNPDKDYLFIESFAGTDGIASLFEYQLGLVADAAFPSMTANSKMTSWFDLVGDTVSVQLTGKNGTRTFYGVIRDLTETTQFTTLDGSTTRTFVRFQATMVPRLWLMSLRVRSRVIQQSGSTTLDVIKTVLNEYATHIPYNTESLTQSYPSCRLKTQYRESDLAFLCRLLEDEGIIWWFKHDSTLRDVLVLSDKQAAYPWLDETTTSTSSTNAANGATYYGSTSTGEYVSGWSRKQVVRRTTVTLTDTTFQNPTTSFSDAESVPTSITVGSVTHSVPWSQSGATPTLGLTDRAARAFQFDRINPNAIDLSDQSPFITAEVQRQAGFQLDREQWPIVTVTGSGTCRLFLSGHKFALTDSSLLQDSNGTYALLSVSHTASQTNIGTSGNSVFSYSNTFTCLPFVNGKVLVPAAAGDAAAAD